MPRGGVRIGAGRPKGKGKFGKETKPIRVPMEMIDEIMDYVKSDGMKFPLYSSKVSAGFPSPADDYVDNKLDLNQFLINHPSSTFFVKVSGDSMKNVGINDDDILVVDKSIDPRHGDIVIAAIDGHLTVKRLYKKDYIALIPENEDYEPIKISDLSDLVIWGVVTSFIHKF